MMRVLIADDNPVFQAVLEAMLTNWGYDVVTASNGQEALGILESEDGPRLAILDYMMPGMDGIEVCRRVRARQDSNYVYILILTAHAKLQELTIAMESGADDFVTKPFRSQELRARLRCGFRILELQQTLSLARAAAQVGAGAASPIPSQEPLPAMSARMGAS
jgi:DNA-binding response OmpR family regulator